MKFLETLKKGWFGFLDMFGFKRSTKYVSNYLHDANMRSGIYMAAVIIVLETWLLIRQTIKYVIPKVSDFASFFPRFFKVTSNYWLFLFLGLAMLAYCLYYVTERRTKAKMITVLVFTGIGLLLCTLLPFESRMSALSDNVLDGILLISLYASIALMHLAIIGGTFYLTHNGKSEVLKSVLIITLFASSCLIFGIRISYLDWFFPSQEGEMKQLICFLMMSIYVACLLIWKPYVSIGIIGVVSVGFFLLLKVNESQRIIPEGDLINYVTFFISVIMVAISIYNQRLKEARKDEELEILATKDKLTGLLAFEYFTNLCVKRVQNGSKVPQDYIYLFLNVTSFKIYNDQRGFEEGNKFLRDVGEIITKEFKNDLVSRQSDDHYVIFAKNEDIKMKLLSVEQQVQKLDLDIRPGIKVGGYILEKIDDKPHRSIEKARYACETIDSVAGYAYREYDKKMHDEFHLVQYIVRHVDEAVEKGYIEAYYQPVVFSNTNKLCGVEALARWIDPKYGFLNPGIFITALEDAQLAYKVDLCMLELVCINMRKVLDNKGKIVPTSINFSRNDFSVIDVPAEVEKITKKYNIPTKYLHVEITESALLGENVNLKDAMKRLKEKGFEIWLDDFGSGYSSFNSLKDYEFDVLKLDMEFLKGFEKNQKSKPLIKSVIDMANQIGMRTLAEGVETKDQSSFLKTIRCERLQGFLYGKPMTYTDLNERIKKGELVIASKLI